MPFYLDSNPQTRLEWQHDIPVNYSGPFLKGSNVLHFAQNTCEIIIQEIRTELYTLRLNVFQFMETLTLNSISQKEGVHSRILLKGNLNQKVKGAGRIYLREGEFTMLWAHNATCKSKFERNIEYRTMDIFYSPSLLQQLVFLFPQLELLSENERPKRIINQPCFITPAMRDIIRQILDCPFDEATRQFYFDLKVREYLFLMLEHAYKKRSSHYRFTPYETGCLIKAHKLLLEDLSKKPLTLRMLSKAAGINEFKLKAGFKQLFGMSVFDCLQEARMEKARKLLLSTNEPIKQICVLSGYPRMTNFITAFRKRFGYTPGSLRRK